MELSIDEKMRLVREMREQAAREEEQNFLSGYGYQRISYDGRGYSEEERTPHGTFGLRMILAFCLFGAFLYLQKQDMTIAGKNAQDIVTLISEDSLPYKP